MRPNYEGPSPMVLYQSLRRIKFDGRRIKPRNAAISVFSHCATQERYWQQVEKIRKLAERLAKEQSND